MEYLAQLLSEEAIYALGWTVLHSLWQGALVALLTLVAFHLLRNHAANTRYWLANGALLAVFGLAIATFFYYYQPIEQLVVYETIGSAEAATDRIDSIGWAGLFQTYFNEHLPLIVTLWLIGMAFFTLRLLGSLVYIERLKNKHQQAMSNYWQERLMHLKNQIALSRSVRLVESALVRVPMVIGWVKPVILLPIGAVNQLSVAQVEAILAHELAHIARHDYLLNVLQSIVETVLYFNPAVWIISAHIRAERENCCDDIALKLCGNSLSYAKALVHLQEVQQQAPLLAMAFSRPKKQLLPRIQRILNQPQNKSQIMEKLITTMTVFAAILFFSFSTEMTGITENSLLEIEEDKNIEIIQIRVAVDTIPAKKSTSKQRIISDDGNKKVEVEVENGEISKLKIDGKIIPEEDFSKHEAEVNELLSNIPPPPPAPPAPPSPPTPTVAPTPPTPPTLPTPLSPSNKTIRIEKMKDGDGNSFLIIKEQEGGEQVLKIEKDGHLFIDESFFDGENLETMVFPDVPGNLFIETWTAAPDANTNLFFDDANNRTFWLQNETPMPSVVWGDMANDNSWAFIAGENHVAPLLHLDGMVTPSVGFPTILSNNSNAIEAQLKRDGLYNDGNYRVVLTRKSLKINGKKRSGAMHKKYKALYEAATNTKMTGNDKVSWKKANK